MRKLTAEYPDEYWDKVISVILMHSLFWGVSLGNI